MFLPALLLFAAVANPGVMQGVPTSSGVGLMDIVEVREAAGLPDIPTEEADAPVEVDEVTARDTFIMSWLGAYHPSEVSDGTSCHYTDGVTAGGITIPVPEPEPLMMVPLPPGVPPKLDVLFCLDTTGSMCDEISVAKTTILSIAEAVAAGDPQPEVRYGLVIYRDLEDDYVTKIYDFTTVELLASILNGVLARGGGDYEESVSEALHKSVHKVSWDDDAVKAIYLIGDAPPHTDYDNGFSHLEAAMAAAERGIVIHAIGCSGIKGNEAEFNQVVEMTGGTFVYLEYGGSLSSPLYEDGFDGDSDHSWVGYGNVTASRDTSGSPSFFLASASVSGGGGSGNNLDSVLTELIQQQAEQAGVKYDEAEEG
jgi:hypothetical protein